MAIDIKKRISFDEFANNLLAIFTSIVREKEAIAVDAGNGSQIILSPHVVVDDNSLDRDAFLSSAGSWRNVNTDSLLENIYSSRSISTRPAVEL